MKANELREGNWVLEHGNAHQIDWKEDAFMLDIFEPIPLTPEILEKCGFVKDEDDIYKKGNCLYWIDSNVIQISLGYHPVMNCPCQSLHQLQNLYFALTGEELKIEL